MSESVSQRGGEQVKGNAAIYCNGGFGTTICPTHNEPINLGSHEEV